MSDIWSFIKLYAMRFKSWYIAGFIALFATNALGVAIPQFLASGLKAADPELGDGQVGRWVLAILGAAIGVMIVRTASRMLIFVPGREAEYLLRNDFFKHLLSMGAPFYRRMPQGDLLSRASGDVQFVRVLIGFAGLQILNVAFALPLNLFMMVKISPMLTLACTVPLILAVVIMRLGALAMMSRMKASREELGELSNEILESYNGVRVVQSYGAEDAMLARFDTRNERYITLNVEVSFIRAFLLPIVTVVGNIAILVLLYMGGRMVARGEMHFGVISAYAVYVGNIVTAMTSLGWVITVVQRGQISLRRLMEVLETEPGRPKVSEALPDGPLAIDVEGLTFTYPVTGTEPVLRDIGFSVRAGATLGIFGTTGSGKSTLVRLLTRLDEPPPGSIRFNGVDISSVDVGELRAAEAVVPQSSYLFSRSIRANIALESEAELDAERLELSVARAGLSSDLAALPNGLDTMVGERGVTLSGGQKQRTSLARAFYRRSRLMILDDALSAVDHDTEQRLIKAIYEDAAERTTVIISHRISALRHADQIIVLEDGEIIERGSHTDLVGLNGLYASTFRTQEQVDDAAAPSEASP